MSRFFDASDDEIITSAGTLNNFTFGTIVVLLRRDSGNTGWSAPCMLHTSGGAAVAGLEFKPTADGAYLVVISGAGDVEHNSLAVTNSDGWVLAAVTKATGTATPRGHKGVMSSLTWTHTNFPSTLANNGSTVSTVRFGQWENTDRFGGEIAAIGVWKSVVLTDNQIEGLAAGLYAWSALSPTALWRFNQAAVTTAVDDLTGNGANQSSRVGTTVDGDEPPGFLYGILPPASAPTTATATIASTAAVDRNAAASLTGTATIASTVAVDRPATASLTVTATIAATASVTRPADAALTGTATIASTATVDRAAASTLTATATVTPVAAVDRPVTSSLTATATIASTAAIDVPVAASTLTATATIAATAQVEHAAQASLTATATIAADADTPIGASLTATATITTTATVTGGADASVYTRLGGVLVPVTLTGVVRVGGVALTF